MRKKLCIRASLCLLVFALLLSFSASADFDVLIDGQDALFGNLQVVSRSCIAWKAGNEKFITVAYELINAGKYPVRLKSSESVLSFYDRSGNTILSVKGDWTIEPYYALPGQKIFCCWQSFSFGVGALDAKKMDAVFDAANYGLQVRYESPIVTFEEGYDPVHLPVDGYVRRKSANPSDSKAAFRASYEMEITYNVENPYSDNLGTGTEYDRTYAFCVLRDNRGLPVYVESMEAASSFLWPEKANFFLPAYSNTTFTKTINPYILRAFEDNGIEPSCEVYVYTLVSRR